MEISPPTAEDLALDRERAYLCSHLLPDPGGEVVRQVLRLLHAAEKRVAELEAALEEKPLYPMHKLNLALLEGKE